MKKILIVEDEKILNDMYAEKLSREGFKITSANTSEKGLRLAKKEKPDLILLDILLPKKNGLFLLEKLRNNPETENIKVVVFSNYDSPEAREKAKKLGIDNYLIKTNYTPKEMVDEVKKYLA